eukprot:1636837-Pleurochrysis_carterae.AAC.1
MHVRRSFIGMALSKLRQVIVAWGQRCEDRWETVRKRRGQAEEGGAAHRARRHSWGQRRQARRRTIE